MNVILLSLVLATLAAATEPGRVRAQGECDEARLQRTAAKADVVMIAEVAELENDALSFWSGVMGVRQHVRYKVKTVLKGELAESVVRVAFYVVHHSATADKDEPQLSPELFKENSVHVVFLKREKKPDADNAKAAETHSYLGLDQNCGALVATPALEENVRRLVSTP